MREALTRMIGPAEPQRCYPAEEHLYPTDHRHYFADDAVRLDSVSTKASMDSFFEMQFQVDAEDDLDQEKKHEESGEGGMDVGGKLTAAVSVA